MLTPPAPPPDESSGPYARFVQTLDLSTGVVTIATETVTVNVSVDLDPALRDGVAHRDSGILRIAAAATSAKTPFSVDVSVEPYRVEGAPTKLGRGFCTATSTPFGTISEGCLGSVSPHTRRGLGSTWLPW